MTTFAARAAAAASATTVPAAAVPADGAPADAVADCGGVATGTGAVAFAAVAADVSVDSMWSSKISLKYKGLGCNSNTVEGLGFRV